MKLQEKEIILSGTVPKPGRNFRQATMVQKKSNQVLFGVLKEMRGFNNPPLFPFELNHPKI